MELDARQVQSERGWGRRGVGALTMGVQQRLIDEICAGERSIAAGPRCGRARDSVSSRSSGSSCKRNRTVEMSSANRGSGWRRSAPPHGVTARSPKGMSGDPPTRVANAKRAHAPWVNPHTGNRPTTGFLRCAGCQQTRYLTGASPS